MSEQELIKRVERLEASRTRFAGLTAIAMIACAGLVLAQLWKAPSVHAEDIPDVVKTRQLMVVDSTGTPRVIIGAPVPDPTYNGKPFRRGGAVSGVILIDGSGTERGGYVTDDKGGNALLTLDAKGQQAVLLLAEPDGDTSFRIWKSEKDSGKVLSSITMGTRSENPFFNLKKNGALVVAEPPGNPQSRDPRGFYK